MSISVKRWNDFAINNKVRLIRKDKVYTGLTVPYQISWFSYKLLKLISSDII